MWWRLETAIMNSLPTANPTIANRLSRNPAAVRSTRTLSYQGSRYIAGASQCMTASDRTYVNTRPALAPRQCRASVHSAVISQTPTQPASSLSDMHGFRPVVDGRRGGADGFEIGGHLRPIARPERVVDALDRFRDLRPVPRAPRQPVDDGGRITNGHDPAVLTGRHDVQTGAMRRCDDRQRCRFRLRHH